MGEWFRSVPMAYVEILLHEDAVKASLRELGSLGCLEFTDLNSNMTFFQRPSINHIQACANIEKDVAFLKQFSVAAGVTLEEGNTDDFLSETSSYTYGGGDQILHTLSAQVSAKATIAHQLKHAGDQLYAVYLQALEKHHVLLLAFNIMPRKVGFAIPLNTDAIAENDHSTDSIEEGGVDVMPIKTCGAGGAGTGIGNTESESGTGVSVEEIRFSRAAGVIDIGDRLHFQRMLYRSVRGSNVYVCFQPLEKLCFWTTPPPELHNRLGFVIFYRGKALHRNISRVCSAFGVKVLDIDAVIGEAAVDMPSHTPRRASRQLLVDAQTVYKQNLEYQKALALSIRSELQQWMWIARREKSIYMCKGLLKTVGGCFESAAAWVPKDQVNRARATIETVHFSMKLPAPLLEEKLAPQPVCPPPTYFRTNPFTEAFQQFVDTYGVARYREINPALFTAATFPFLFGMMYGDIGHGTCFCLGAVFLTYVYQPSADGKDSDIQQGLYTARYMLLAMSICAIYCGFIYNDFFSLTFHIFKSGYEYEEEEIIYSYAQGDGSDGDGMYVAINGTSSTSALLQKRVYGDSAEVYAFGVDPAWHMAENDLLFFNSMKMKTSVIMGITQMVGGILLRGANNKHFANKLDYWCEFVPQLLFALSLFGYMVVLIFLKWSINWQERMALGTCSYDIDGTLGACNLSGSSSNTCYNAVGVECSAKSSLAEVCTLDYGGSGDGCQPPNLITTLINIALKPGQVDEPLYEGQAAVQLFLIGIAGICVPWMLCIKPAILLSRHNSLLVAKGEELSQIDGSNGTTASITHNPMLSTNDEAADPKGVIATKYEKLSLDNHNEVGNNSDDENSCPAEATTTAGVENGHPSPMQAPLPLSSPECNISLWDKLSVGIPFLPFSTSSNWSRLSNEDMPDNSNTGVVDVETGAGISTEMYKDREEEMIEMRTIINSLGIVLTTHVSKDSVANTAAASATDTHAVSAEGQYSYSLTRLLGKPSTEHLHVHMHEIGKENENEVKNFVNSKTNACDLYEADHAGHGEGTEDFEFGELFIHQGIETIEFVLGMVSNTASYLRLWALSLAHTELAAVFWEKCLLGAICTYNPFFIVSAFVAFAAITTAVLLFMDVLECFLHAMRLHWVEFQSKFYKADGRRFTPFDWRMAVRK